MQSGCEGWETYAAGFAGTAVAVAGAAVAGAGRHVCWVGEGFLRGFEKSLVLVALYVDWFLVLVVMVRDKSYPFSGVMAIFISGPALPAPLFPPSPTSWNI